MGMKMKTPPRVLRYAVIADVDADLSKLLDRLVLLGEFCYEEAITRITYTHRKGILASSTGFIVVKDGKKYAEGGFLAVHGPEMTDEDPDGTLIGREYAESLIAEYPTGYAMIFVAGADYAGYVEAKGFNVITSAHIWAEQEAIKILNGMGL